MPELAARAGVPRLWRSSGSPTPTRGRCGAALERVSVELAAGEFAVLAGSSASGKTTLLRAACGLVPHFHGGELSGSVEVAGLDALEVGPALLAGAVGYVAQDPEAQVVSTTVAAEIELPLELRGESPAARSRAVEEVALALAIPHLLGRTVDTLSGGELQRVALAAALVTRPSLVLLDEPTSQLDPVAGDELVWLLRRLNEEWGVAVLLAEHRLERCLAAADRVIAMDSGTVAFDGAPGEFLAWAIDSEPVLATPSARMFSLAGIDPLPVGVRDARQILSADGRGAGATGPPPRSHSREGTKPVSDRRRGALARKALGRGAGGPQATTTAATDEGCVGGVGRGGSLRDVLRGIELTVAAGESGGADGAKRGREEHPADGPLAGLIEPVRGADRVGGEMALLTQSPGDYLVRERVGDELPSDEGREALEMVGLEHAVDADPRDLSGGERQRLALAIALAGRTDGAAPARGGRPRRADPGNGPGPARRSGRADRRPLRPGGAAVIVATHDVEFAASFAERVVLLGDGVVIADGAAEEILSGGWYFATEVARVLDLPGVITPEQGAAALAEADR